MLLCGLDGSDHMVKGEWMGYMKSPSAFVPFAIRNEGVSELLFDGEGDTRKPTTLGRDAIVPGTLFTVHVPVGEPKDLELTFEIVSCHKYA